MAPPCTLKMGPITNCTCPSNLYRLVAILIAWLGAIPTFFMEWIYFGILFKWNPLGWRFMSDFLSLIGNIEPWFSVVAWLGFPFNLLAAYYVYVLCSVQVARFFLFLEKRRHEPKEGIFPRDLSDPDYFHWNARRYIKKFPAWLVKLTPFPWMRRSYIYNKLGAKIGKHVGNLDAWIDLEFVTIEKGVAMGCQVAVTSHYFTSKYLIVKSVHVGRECLVGERVRISPGTIMEENAVLLAKSVTKLDQHIKPGEIFGGNPAGLIKVKEE